MTTMTLFDRHTQGRSQPEPMRDPRAECARRAYLGMAPFYRPEAPNDGGGCSELSAEEILDRLDREARDYALAFMCQRNGSIQDLRPAPAPPYDRPGRHLAAGGDLSAVRRGGEQCYRGKAVAAGAQGDRAAELISFRRRSARTFAGLRSPETRPRTRLPQSLERDLNLCGS
jgi:hypothetical protein